MYGAFCEEGRIAYARPNIGLHLWTSRHNMLLTCIWCLAQRQVRQLLILLDAGWDEAQMFLFAQKRGGIVIVRFARIDYGIRYLLLLLLI